ncbi:MAG: zinc-dependent metalloprotease [Actinomycetia bacterium]|nr:zinc-dependent metalloprotease [Actinomycetes bacterium]
MGVVDWEAATSVGIRMVADGPEITPDAAAHSVDQLLEHAASAVEPVRAATGLYSDPAEHRTEVVDRPEWIRSNVAGFALLLQPLEDRLAAQGRGTSAGAGLGQKISALEIGGVLSWVATKVLGQYEAITPPGQPGRLMLVAPNIVAAERQLQVDPSDFRMWVCLHEETHRVQFGGVPWLADYFQAEIDTFLSAVDVGGGEVLKRAAAVTLAVAKVLAGGSGANIVDAAQSPAQRESFDRLTALMSLLEGHAEYVMDVAAPDLIPSLPQIRTKFDNRRAAPGSVDGLLRRLLGMDVKMQQYTDGRRFVNQAVDTVGLEAFNVIWTSPDALPTLSEVSNPRQWCERVA